jgi:hypothetical protein
MFLFLYLKNPKTSTQKLLDTIKTAGYKINLQKSLAFLYTNNEQNQRIYENNSMYSIFKKLKYLGINLTKDINDLYKENYNPLKRLRKTIEGGEISHVHG